MLVFENIIGEVNVESKFREGHAGTNGTILPTQGLVSREVGDVPVLSIHGFLCDSLNVILKVLEKSLGASRPCGSTETSTEPVKWWALRQIVRHY